MLDIFLTVNQGVELDDATYLDGLAQINGVTKVLGTATAFGQFKLDESDESFIDGFVTGYSTPLEEGLSIEPMRLLEGEYPAEGEDQIVIEQRMAEKYELGVGDQIYLRILSPSRENDEIGTTEAWTITGIVFHPYIGAANNGGFNVTTDESMYSSVANVTISAVQPDIACLGHVSSIIQRHKKKVKSSPITLLKILPIFRYSRNR